MCRFAINSDADGCSIFHLNSGNQMNTIFIPKISIDEDTATMIIDIPAGEYTISVYDVIDGVIQSSIPAITTTING